MRAIKNNKNVNICHSGTGTMDGRSVVLRDYLPLISQLEGWVSRMQISTNAVQNRLETGHSTVDLLESLEKLEADCEQCRAVLDSAIADT